MACKYNIKVVEHNDFTLLFPLKKRTYVASLPIDEDIVIMDLENVKVTIGGVEFASTLDERGVMVAVAYDALERGTYDIIITAEYHGAQIRAAYFEGLTIVNWNMQSDAEQYLPGSPIVMQAAFVIGGPLTDAELEALKAEYRDKIAAAEAAEEAAQAAKEAYDEKAEALDDVAKETTLTQGVADIREDISHIDIDTTTLAKQGSNANADISTIQSKIGTPASGQPTDLFAAIAAGGGGGGGSIHQVSVPDSGSAASQELAPNTLYIFPNRTSDLTLTLGTPLQDEVSEYHFIIEVGATLPTITLPSGITWKSSETIAFDTDTTYEVSILDNYAIFVAW